MGTCSFLSNFLPFLVLALSFPPPTTTAVALPSASCSGGEVSSTIVGWNDTASAGRLLPSMLDSTPCYQPIIDASLMLSLPVAAYYYRTRATKAKAKATWQEDVRRREDHKCGLAVSRHDDVSDFDAWNRDH